MLNIFHISDTHGQHKRVQIPDNVDIIVHSGDSTNYKDPIHNEREFFDFIDWYTSIEVKHKVYVAGNHDAYIFFNKKQAEKVFEENNIIYLNKTSAIIEGLHFYGDPTSPLFNDWHFMAKRKKMSKHWDLIPKDVEVLITHTPPKNILDLTLERDHSLKQAGCSNLYNRIFVKRSYPKLKAHLFGHIHNCKDIINGCVLVKDGVQFSNGSMVKDGRFDMGLDNKGNLIKISKS